MYRILFSSLIVLGLGNSLRAQYTPMSPYLIDPTLTIGYVDSCAQFWMQALDEIRGGYFTNIDRQGNMITAWGTNKNLLTQTRNAYGFARAYMMTGNDEYREFARAGLDFMYEHAWDPVNGGWYSQLDINGNVQGATNGRSAFDAHYALLGPAVAFEAFHDSTDLEMLLTGYEHLEDVYWDDRESFHGYYDWSTYNGSNAYNKSFNATVDAITTHLLSLYLQTGSQTYLEKLHKIAEEIIDHLVGSMPSQSVGFVEEFDSNWNWDNGETMTIMGHVLKSAWCLARVNQIDPRGEYIDAAEVLMNDVLTHGYDHDLGGPYKDYDRVSGDMLMWGNPDTAKAWWQMEQAITSGLTLYQETGDETYLVVADETLHFFMQYFVDHTYGDVYENRTRYGDQTWGLNKGSGGKAGYHSIETGYYTYLYASMFLHEAPFSLYYWVEPEAVERVITLSPSTYDLSRPLQIDSILLDGMDYSSFEGVSRQIMIPAHTGGEFQVTFSPGSVIATDEFEHPVSSKLSKPYPNPFNPSTSLTLLVEHPGPVDVSVYDLQGRKVEVLLSSELLPGRYSMTWNGQIEGDRRASAGIYIFRASLGSHTFTQKGLLLK